jgi:DNA processing protein
VASGLARGIDTSAHQKALTTGTIAVVAGGIDVVYPQENQKLYEQIADIGCIVSDQPMGLEPMAKLFPRRNRIISGLSLGIVVVEAAKRSGSLITARMALEQGREVFAVPGSPLDPRANGTNDLIRQGATLTEGAPDILEALSQPRRTLFEEESEAFIPAPIRIDESELPHIREKVIENLSTCPIDIDELARNCQFSLPSILTVLLELELAGRLERHPGHKVSLIL